MKGPVLMREYCSISTFPMPQTTDSAKNRKPVAAKGASKRPCLSEGEHSGYFYSKERNNTADSFKFSGLDKR